MDKKQPRLNATALCPLRCLLVGTCLLALHFSAAVALADTPSVNVRSFQPPTSADGSLYLDSTQNPKTGQWTIGSWLSWAQRPVVLRDTSSNDVVAHLVAEQASLDLFGSIAVANYASVGLSLPFVAYQHGDSDPFTDTALGGQRLPSQALGDFAINGKVTLLSYDEMGGYGLAALARITVPTGSSKSLVGEGAFTSEIRLLGELSLIAASLQATFGFKQRTEERTFANVTLGDELPWGLGITVYPRTLGLDPSGRFAWTLETHGSLPAGPSAPFTNAALSPVLLGASMRYRMTDSIRFFAGFETSLTRAVGTPTLRSLVGLSWTPASKSPDNSNDNGIPGFVRKRGFLADECDHLEEGESCGEVESENNGVVEADKPSSSPPVMDSACSEHDAAAACPASDPTSNSSTTTREGQSP